MIDKKKYENPPTEKENTIIFNILLNKFKIKNIILDKLKLTEKNVK